MVFQIRRYILKKQPLWCWRTLGAKQKIYGSMIAHIRRSVQEQEEEKNWGSLSFVIKDNVCIIAELPESR